MADALLNDIGLSRLTEYFASLDEIRESGVTNMFGAAPYLRSEWPVLTKQEASKVLLAWMETFEDGPTAEFRAEKALED